MIWSDCFSIRCLRKRRQEITIAFTIISFFYVVSVFYSNDNKYHRTNSDPVMSYCSKEADNRGPHQNVISYSLYGNFSDPKHFIRYTGAIKYILSNITQVYPGWVMRVYLEMEPGNSLGNMKLKELFNGYPFVDLCNVTRVLELRNINEPLQKMTWRFLPLLDPLVDRMLCRDTDNLVTEREVAAVNQWLTDSQASFHIMHDHPLHCASKFLGSSWGVKILQNRQTIFKAVTTIFYAIKHKIEYGFDQTLLNDHLWPLAINDHMHHDSFCCEGHGFSNSIPFPTRRLSAEYISQTVSGSALLPETCPENCRPKDHPEWTRC